VAITGSRYSSFRLPIPASASTVRAPSRRLNLSSNTLGSSVSPQADGSAPAILGLAPKQRWRPGTEAAEDMVITRSISVIIDIGSLERACCSVPAILRRRSKHVSSGEPHSRRVAFPAESICEAGSSIHTIGSKANCPATRILDTASCGHLGCVAWLNVRARVHAGAGRKRSNGGPHSPGLTPDLDRESQLWRHAGRKDDIGAPHRYGCEPGCALGQADQ